MEELTPTQIHCEDQDKIIKLTEALKTHILDNNEQFRLTTINDIETKAQLKAISTTLESWTPYITEGIKRSDAYKLVSKDLKDKSKGLKWWVSFAIVLVTFMGALYSVLEKLRFIK